MRNIYIQSTSLFLSDSNTPQNVIKEELKVISGQSFRRINRYILLGLAGLFRLANISKTDKLTSLYIGTKKGCVQDTTEILHQMYKEKLLPMPFAFIAANANMANYHIANTLGLQSGSYTISHEYSPFEMAFKMSLSDLVDLKGDSSIVGCIDEEISTDEGFKNGSYWIKLTTDSQATIGKIISYQEFFTFEELFKTDLSCMSVIVNDSTKESIEKFVKNYTSYRNIFDVFGILEKQEYKTIAIIFRLSRNKISLCVIDSSR